MQEFEHLRHSQYSGSTPTRVDARASTYREVFNRDPQLVLKEVDSFKELCGAFSLVHDLYVAAGYMDRHQSGMRYSGSQLTSFSRTLAVTRAIDIIGTGTVVIDGGPSLPSEDFFGDIFQSLRSSGRRLAEGTLLACRDTTKVPASAISEEIIRLGIYVAAAQDADDFLVTVNPKHVRFWSNSWGFEALSEVRDCSTVKGAPGVLLRCAIKEAMSGELKATPSFQKKVLARRISRKRLANQYNLSRHEAGMLLSARPEISDYLPASELELSHLQA